MSVHMILVPTDFSTASDEAVAYAANLAYRMSATLVLLHVAAPPFLGPIEAVPPDTEEMLSCAHRSLRDLAERLPVPTCCVVAHGAMGECIVEAAALHHVGLIVMATHARTSIARFLMGSIAEYVLRRAPCPVVTLRKGTSMRGEHRIAG